MTESSATGRSPKGGPSPKSVITTEVDDTDEKKEKPVKEVPFIHDTGFFKHDTGDTYDGGFEARKKDHSLKMHGQGVYTTAEGDIYAGLWELDKIAATDQTTISYNDGAKFEGVLKDWVYTGHGTYTYPDGSILTGEFADNCPVGNLVLTDPNGHTWLGKADHGFGWFEPVNHFYEFLETTCTRIKRRHKTVPDTSNELESPLVDDSPAQASIKSLIPKTKSPKKKK